MGGINPQLEVSSKVWVIWKIGVCSNVVSGNQVTKLCIWWSSVMIYKWNIFSDIKTIVKNFKWLNKKNRISDNS